VIKESLSHFFSSPEFPQQSDKPTFFQYRCVCKRLGENFQEGLRDVSGFVAGGIEMDSTIASQVYIFLSLRKSREKIS